MILLAFPVGNERKPMAFTAEIQPSGTLYDLWSVHFTGVNSGWAGGQRETLVRTSDSGASWHVKMTDGDPDGYFLDIDFRDENHGVIAATAGWGPDSDPAYGGTDNHVVGTPPDILARNWSAVMRTSNGGATWTEMFLPTNFYISSAHFIDDNTGMVTAFGSPTHTDSDIWWTTNAGHLFVRYGDWQYYYDSAMLDANNWWVVGDEIIHTTDGGATWKSKSVSNHLNAVCFFDANHGWAAGNGGYITSTSDGGTTWGSKTVGSSDFLGINFPTIDQGWAVGRGGKIYSTTDGGGTWNPQTSPTTKDLCDVFFPDPSFGWAVGKSGTIVFIHDGTPPPPPVPESGNAVLSIVLVGSVFVMAVFFIERKKAKN
jgi:photosystem II stability/assembly factor-like uncharacterized protein